MLRVTIELLPYGDETRKRHLGTCEIANDASGTPTRGNYHIRFSRRGKPFSTWKETRVEGFPRKRLGAWDLLFLALRNIVGDRARTFRHAPSPQP